MTIEDEIFLERKKAGLYHKDLAEALGVKAQTLIDIEKGRFPIGEDYKHQILAKIKELSENKEK